MPPEPPSLPERDLALLWDMLLAARDAQSFVAGLDEAGFLASRLHQAAVIRALEVLGEAAGRVSRDSCAALPELPWREMTGLRHRLIHGYAEVRLCANGSAASGSSRCSRPVPSWRSSWSATSRGRRNCSGSRTFSPSSAWHDPLARNTATFTENEFDPPCGAARHRRCVRPERARRRACPT